MLSIPFLAFWLLVFLGRRELGCRGVLIAVGIWAVLLAGFMLLRVSPYFFVIPEALLDIVLILILFQGDIAIS